MKALNRYGWILFILSLVLTTSGCFEITGSEDERPCGDQLACPVPKQCINQVCVSQCLNNEDCQEGQACESLRCVPRSQENQAKVDLGGNMEADSNLEADINE